ncbi:MAG: tryptophan--tRNA ligase [Candidatus Marsarchaeota archaeon]|nr:tryptophan--tRNA ligase [Candidatus Marsarchaeota archaeon]
MVDDYRVTPWQVEGEVDYERLVREFGTQKIDENLKASISSLTGELHVLIRRGVFFSHRDLDLVLKDYRDGKGFFLYTGRGPSKAMHIGHLLPFVFTKWLQDKFGVNLYVEVTDDEKFLTNQGVTLDEARSWARENILDIIAVGFDPDKTFIFQDTEYIRNMYPRALEISKKLNFSEVKSVFGFEGSANIGWIFYPAIQMVPTMFERKRCLIPSGIDQDPYWRLQRDIAESLGYPKAAQIQSRFLPPLTGISGKMSASQPETAVYLNDDPNTVRKKIMRYAFSGGQSTVELHRKLGGDPWVDIPFIWLYYFFEDDDSKIRKVEEDYRSGRMLTGELKELLTEKLNGFLGNHAVRREEATSKIDVYKFTGKLAQKMWSTVFD